MIEVESRGKTRYVGIGIVCLSVLIVSIWFWQGRGMIPGDASDQDQVAFGGRVYGRICANCHGSGLDGQLGWQQPMKDGTRLAPAHNTNGQTWHHPDETLFEIVKFGGDYLKQNGTVSRMPAFENKLTDDEIWSVIAFIKSNWPADIQAVQPKAAATEP